MAEIEIEGILCNFEWNNVKYIWKTHLYSCRKSCPNVYLSPNSSIFDPFYLQDR